MSLADIKQAARKTTDSKGQPVIQIPLQVWEQFVAEGQAALSQKSQIEALLHEWEAEADEPSDEWWGQFLSFVKA